MGSWAAHNAIRQLPICLQKGNPKKEFMNTMFLEGVRQHRKNNGEEMPRSLQMEIAVDGCEEGNGKALPRRNHI